MNHPWAICIARVDAESLAGLRLGDGIEVSEVGQLVWLRGRRWDESNAAKLAALPASARYEWLAPDGLRRIEQRIPSTKLPDVPWQPLSAWLRVEVPAAAMPANEPAAISLRLVRSTDERDPELLMTHLTEFDQFARQAAQVRLDRLQFAGAADGRVLVRGSPLPPLHGQRWVLHRGVAVPAGFAWQPAVNAEVLARCLGVSGDALVLWNADGTITRLCAEQFVPATRSAVRSSARALTT